MTAMELFELLGSARDSYILEVQKIRSGEIPVKSKGIPRKRLLLIAAVVALTLLLVGCAVVYVLSLRDLKIGQYFITEPEHYGPNWEVIEAEEKVYELISVQGFADSANQQAVQEWWQCQKRWEWLDARTVSGRLPDGYYAAYGCKNEEMMNELDRILEKYSLQPLGEGIGFQRDQYQIMLDALKLERVCISRDYAETEYTSGHFHPEGAFRIGVNISLGEEFDWPYLVMTEYCYFPKDYFDYYYIRVENLSEFQQWEYVLPNGSKALLALGEEDALILADREDASMFLHLDARMGIDTMTPEMVEKIADLFDFSIVPRSLTEREAWEARTAIQILDDQQRQAYQEEIANYEQSAGKEDFSGWVKETLENSYYDPADLGYAFYDIDGNGKDDLLIGRDGYCTAIYWEKDGQIQQFSSAATELYLCQDQVIGYVLMPGETYFFFTRVDNGSSQGKANVRYLPGHPEGEYRKYSMEAWNKYDNISKEEYESILNSFERIPIKFLPLSDYPLEEPPAIQTKRSHLFQEPFESYAEKIRIRLTDKEERWSRWAYDIRDLNGDGIEELIWREDDRYFLYTMADGKVSNYIMTDDGTLTVCEGSIVEAVHHHGPENRTYRYYRIEADRAVLVDYLRYDVDANPENPWFRSPDLSGQDITLEPISEMEAKSIIASHESLDIEMKPIADYPFE